MIMMIMISVTNYEMDDQLDPLLSKHGLSSFLFFLSLSKLSKRLASHAATCTYVRTYLASDDDSTAANPGVLSDDDDDVDELAAFSDCHQQQHSCNNKRKATGVSTAWAQSVYVPPPPPSSFSVRACVRACVHL